MQGLRKEFHAKELHDLHAFRAEERKDRQQFHSAERKAEIRNHPHSGHKRDLTDDELLARDDTELYARDTIQGLRNHLHAEERHDLARFHAAERKDRQQFHAAEHRAEHIHGGHKRDLSETLTARDDAELYARDNINGLRAHFHAEERHDLNKFRAAERKDRQQFHAAEHRAGMHSFAHGHKRDHSQELMARDTMNGLRAHFHAEERHDLSKFRAAERKDRQQFHAAERKAEAHTHAHPHKRDFGDDELLARGNAELSARDTLQGLRNHFHAEERHDLARLHAAERKDRQQLHAAEHRAEHAHAVHAHKRDLSDELVARDTLQGLRNHFHAEERHDLSKFRAAERKDRQQFHAAERKAESHSHGVHAHKRDLDELLARELELD
ncbi:hypothetical protein ABKN59_001664 [Abortiporus biennis]